MSFLRFLPDEVQRLADQLESSGEAMRTACGSLTSAATDQLGDADIVSSCNDFSDSWDYGFGQLSELTKGISEFAEDCVRTFSDLQVELEEILHEGDAE